MSVYAVKGTALKPVKATGEELDEAGRTVLSVKDKNGKKATSYVVVVGQTGDHLLRHLRPGQGRS